MTRLVSVWTNCGSPFLRGCVMCLLVVVASVPEPASGENWPQWRGPTNNGLSSESQIATKWSREQNIAWRLDLPGQAASTPAVWDGRIFLTTADGADLLVLCLTTTGKELWRRKVATGNRAVGLGGSDEGNLASPSPSTDGTHVWAFFGTGDLACFDFNGTEKWKHNLQQRYGPFELQFAMHSTPVLHGDRLFVQVIHGPMRGDSEPSYVVAFDKLTGRELWKKDRKTGATSECKHAYTSPVIYDDGKQVFLLTHGADYLVAYRLSDGEELWRHGGMNPLPDARDQPATPAAAARGDGGTLARLDVNRDGKIARSEIPEEATRRVFDRLVEQHKLDGAKTYTIAEFAKATGVSDAPQSKSAPAGGYHPTLRFVASPAVAPGIIVVPTAKRGSVLALRPDLRGDATASKDSRHWVLPRGTPDVPSPLIHAGFVYLASEDGVLTCLDAKTGDVVYRERVHVARHRASPIYANGHIYVPAFDGRVSVVKVGRQFELVEQNDLGSSLTASPVVSDGTLFIRTFESLWAIRAN